ncbi:MAG: hypothetical protein MUC90_07800 [Thermoplasmata archaeon]|jgi:hypothetical protein|nr:hypothetical protein [Thermoplasmata archaeon]
MEPSRYGGRAAFLTIIALLMIVHLANEDWYIVYAWNGEHAVALTDYPFGDDWYGYQYEEAEDVLLWTGVLVWLGVFSAVAFAGFIFIDEKGLGIAAGIASAALISTALVYFAVFFEAALLPEERGDMQTGWTGTVFAVVLLVAATAIRGYVVIRGLPPSVRGTANGTEEIAELDHELGGGGQG